MSQAIPTSDPALLAAQSRAGQAGVDAYEAARRELEQRQGTATAQAMYAAQQRGAPTASMRSAFTQANDAYNQRIASLTQASASYRDSMAAREARMADYSRAIGEARGLIADEAAQAVAPIEARSEFELQRLRQQGQNAVDEIEAQIRLEAARMAAAQASRRGGGGGGGGGGGRRSLGGMSESELRASLLGGGGARIEQLQGEVSDANRRAASNQAMAARWTGRGMQDWADRQEEQEEWVYVPGQGLVRQSQAASPGISTGAFSASRNIPRREPTPTGPQPSPNYNLQVGPGGTGMGSRPFTGPQPVMVAPPPPPPSPVTQALQQAFPQMYDSSQSFLGQQYMDGQTYLQRAARDMDPFQQNILATAYQQRAGSPWRDDEQIAETLYGSGDVMAEAMRQTGTDLFLQGYDITDPEMMRVMQGSGEYAPGMSLADVYGVQRGLGTVAEQQAAQQAADEEQLRLTAEAQEQQIADTADAQEVEDTGFVFETTGVEPDRINAPLAAQVTTLESPEWPIAVQTALEAAVAAEDEDDFTILLGEAGLRDNTALAILRQMYRDGVLFLNAAAGG